jgi:hypothetical protein
MAKTKQYSNLAGELDSLKHGDAMAEGKQPPSSLQRVYRVSLLYPSKHHMSSFSFGS